MSKEKVNFLKNKEKKLDENILKNNILNIEKLNEKIIDLKDKLNIKKKKMIYLNDKLSSLKKKFYDLNLRSKADIDNMRKRNQKNIENIYKYSLEKFSIDLLPVIDSLKNALISSRNKNSNLDSNFQGISLILKKFLSVMKKFGISLINEINVDFNANYHQAISVIETDNYKLKDNVVVEILQDGYLLNDRLLRPAMVKVLKHKNKK